MVDDQKILGERRRALEEEFFRKEDQRLPARLREHKAKEASREELSRISGIKNTAILDRLVELGVHAETLVAPSIVPLAQVAWAGGAAPSKGGAGTPRRFWPGSSSSGPTPRPSSPCPSCRSPRWRGPTARSTRRRSRPSSTEPRNRASPRARPATTFSRAGWGGGARRGASATG